MWNATLEESQTGIKIAGRNINNFRYADDITLMVESEQELKILLMKAKEESEKAGLKLSIQKTKIMASNPIIHGNRWQKNGSSDWHFLAPKSLQTLTAAMKLKGTCSLEEKRWPV